MSNITAYAPPCMTQLMFPYDASIGNDVVLDATIEGGNAGAPGTAARGEGGPREASSTLASVMTFRSKPLYPVSAAMRCHLPAPSASRTSRRARDNAPGKEARRSPLKHRVHSCYGLFPRFITTAELVALLRHRRFTNRGKLQHKYLLTRVGMSTADIHQERAEQCLPTLERRLAREWKLA